ncbi:imidazole glycerol phosphate synthase subunit HisH [Paenibacillus thalictri]|uniref:Imidazole glycerol phosphate synthase subunit HisH n=1 Tax=Paenibacillus thalictri TaxID=2527873 RepID=A0A4Q9DEF3_9BACL|nr:imidazole glycerol phosphate synthase subunit HisH [Paenibacillus thalictri]TBL67781.1 imidazole glycerol phosphate synthase subunit HisH [Paenibacillus thalictri]
MIGIIDYGMGNLRSVSNAIYYLGYDFILVDNEQKLDGVSHVILPGVGAYNKAVDLIKEKGLFEAIRKYAVTGRPFLGICLGMQLLSDNGHEGGMTEGFSFIPGTVSRLSEEFNLPIPHVGWNTVHFTADHPVFHKVKNDLDFYFTHSYHFVCEKNEYIIGKTDYGQALNTIVAKNNVIGFQFHPEKSQKNGLKLIENFCEWDGKC